VPQLAEGSSRVGIDSIRLVDAGENGRRAHLGDRLVQLGEAMNRTLGAANDQGRGVRVLRGRRSRRRRCKERGDLEVKLVLCLLHHWVILVTV